MARPRFVGLDLAWGERARTGVAVADTRGRLQACASVRTDDEVCELVERHAPGPLVAAVDAPLVVTNPAGRRDCEAQVQRLFGRYGAGPYPSNLANPLFAAGTRGGRLCRRLGLDVSLDRGAARQAVEVYPHPAMVVLFGLDRVLPYKGKPGRTVDGRRAALLVLMRAMTERLGVLRLDASPRWAQLLEEVSAATRPVHLEQVEDEVDGVFCAFLAWHWHAAGPRAHHLLGDPATGCIVVPAVSLAGAPA